MPITYAETPAEIEEERRLLYVGMTRARLDLALSWALARQPGGRASPQAVAVPRRRCSREEARAAAEADRSPRRARMCRECGKPLSTAAEKKRRRCADCPASVRRGAVRAAARSGARSAPDEESVPAFVVFTDATLS